MKLRFSWRRRFDELVPECSSDVVNQDGVSLLSRLLTDWGGGAYTDALPWFAEGLRRLREVKQGGAEAQDWAMNSCGARLSREGVTVYWMYDDDYTETVGLSSFEQALRAWIGFIRTPPDATASQSVEV
jgi:hypothetical protein